MNVTGVQKHKRSKRTAPALANEGEPDGELIPTDVELDEDDIDPMPEIGAEPDQIQSDHGDQLHVMAVQGIQPIGWS